MIQSAVYCIIMSFLIMALTHLLDCALKCLLITLKIFVLPGQAHFRYEKLLIGVSLFINMANRLVFPFSFKAVSFSDLLFQ